MDYFYIQRISFHDHKGPIEGVDQLLDYDYMGNSSFEFGALNKSLRQLTEFDLKVFRTEYKSDIGRGLFLLCEEKDRDKYTEYLPLFIEDNCSEEKFYLSESLMNDRSKGNGQSYNRFECWWDIKNHFIFCLGKENAHRIRKGILAYKAKLANNK